MEWFKFRPAHWYRLTRGMSASAKGRFMEETVDALMDGKTGVNRLADAMVAEAAELSERQANRRRKKAVTADAENQTAQNHGEPRLTAENHGEPRPTIRKKERENREIDTTVRNESESTLRARARVEDSVSGSVEKSVFSASQLREDPQGYVWGLPDSALDGFAVWYCREEENKIAVAAYRKFIRKFGERAFRIVLDKFVAACEGGEEPDNRGAAFMAGITREAKERGGA